MNDDSLFSDQPAPTNDSLFSEEPAPKSLAGFGQNLVQDVKGNVTGLGDLAKGLVTHPVDTISNVPAGLVNEGKRIGLGELLTGNPGKAAEKFGNAAYDKPFSTFMDVAPVVGAAGKALGIGGAAAEGAGAAGAAEEGAKAAETAAVVPKSTIGQRIGAHATAGALDLNPLAVRKLATKAGASPEATVLDLGSKANELIPDLVKATDSANDKFTKVLNTHDDAGAQIGSIVKSATQGTQGALPEAGETIAALRKAAEDYYQVDGGDLALQKTADRLESLQKAGKLDFDRLSKVKSDIGKGFNKTDAPPGTEEIYGTLSDGLNKVIDRLSVEDPTLGPDFQRLKQVYTTTSRLLPAMSRTAAKEVAGASVGGGLGSKLGPALLGGAVGGPGGAMLGAGAKYLQEAIAPDLGKNLAYMALKPSAKAVAAIQKAFPNLSQAEAASIAARMGSQKPKGMSQGGRVPDDVRKYVTKAC